MDKSLAKSHQPRKRFGQNFLQDEGIIAQIIAAIEPRVDDLMVEIGPGLGALTAELLPLLQKLHVIEFDRDLIPKLKKTCANLGELVIHQGDALRFDFVSLILGVQKLRIVGNLPYNISSPLIFHLLDFAPHIKDMHFMLQKEVADRISAKVSTKAYGRLSIMVQYFCRAEKLFDVAPQAFHPQPKVTSSFIRLIPHKKILPQAKDFARFSEIVKIAFNQRRKTLRNALKSIISAEELEKLGIDAKLRPEQLSVEDYVKISNVMEK